MLSRSISQFIPDLYIYRSFVLQFDFDFVEVHRVKEFSFRPLAFCESEDDEQVSGSFSRKNPEKSVSLTRSKRTSEERTAQRKSVWNVDGEIIEEPSVHVR